MLVIALQLCALGVALFVILGFFGNLWPAFDTMAHFRVHASAALMVAALALLLARAPASGLAALLVAALGLYSTVPFLLPSTTKAPGEPDAPRYTLLQMNLRFDAADPARALSLIAQLRPDVVTLQEITPGWQEALERLGGAYPHRFFCIPGGGKNGDVAILSRRPFVEADPGTPNVYSVCDGFNAFAAKTIDFNGMPVTVVAEHMRWPWPANGPTMLDALVPTLRTLRDPLIVAGDFNATPWSAAVQNYARASGTRVLAGIGPSWLNRHLPAALTRFVGLPIDNILVSDAIQPLGVRALGPTSSDHLPVLLTFTMRFALPEEPDVQSAAR